MINRDIWLVGTGLMAIEYGKVLKALDCDFTVIGRGEENCNKFSEAIGVPALPNGVEAFLQTNPGIPKAAIVAVSIENLASTTIALMNYGVKYILLEKPGVGYVSEIDQLVNVAETTGSEVLLAYNRRFYASTTAAKQLIEEDGGPTSLHFEFTEWSHVISTLKKHVAEHHNWFLGNSSHVIDMAFYLCGKPAELCSFVGGGLEWHPSSSVFAGAGRTEKGVLFSYNANWEAPGRWVVEVLTKKRRFIFKPIEKLQVQELGSVAVNPVEIDDSLDTQYKPGLYLQMKSFLEEQTGRFCAIEEQKENIYNFYCKMSNYSK
jgi:predicted dehydrogenase